MALRLSLNTKAKLHCEDGLHWTCVCCCRELINKQGLCCLKSKQYFVLTYTFHLVAFIYHRCPYFRTKRNINGVNCSFS